MRERAGGWSGGMVGRAAAVPVLGLLTLLGGSCAETRRPTHDGPCTPGRTTCDGNAVLTCNADGSAYSAVVECGGDTPVCVADLGCAVCRPGRTFCEGLLVFACREDGLGHDWVEACDSAAGERCESGRCTDLSAACEAARTAASYEGCDYWPVQTSNNAFSDVDAFRYGLVIGNRQTATANVEVRNADGLVAAVAVPPNSTRTLEIDWNETLRLGRATAIVRNGAFRVRSDVPVTVYQFNPLRYADGRGGDFSWSSDASLLLPRHALTGDYIVAARETFMAIGRSPLGDSTIRSPGFLAVVGTEDNTEVQVRLTANVQGGTAIPPRSHGETATFRLDRYDVVQVLSALPADCVPARVEEDPHGRTIGYCKLGADYDLTGTEVHADKPVAVVAGHNCTFVPFDRWACDHLEEAIYPLQMWGTRYLATWTHPVVDEPNLWRVVSGTDGNEIRFVPEVHPPVALNRAEWLEFASVEDFAVMGSGALLVVQYLVGGGTDEDSIGDPAMALAVPVEQYRTGYDFLAPEDYRDDPATGQRGESWVNIVAPDGATVLLDGLAVPAFRPIPGSGFGVAGVRLAGGSHVATSDRPFGIMCYGYGNFTSYAYPGGLNAEPINLF